MTDSPMTEQQEPKRKLRIFTFRIKMELARDGFRVTQRQVKRLEDAYRNYGGKVRKANKPSDAHLDAAKRPCCFQPYRPDAAIWMRGSIYDFTIEE